LPHVRARLTSSGFLVLLPLLTSCGGGAGTSSASPTSASSPAIGQAFAGTLFPGGRETHAFATPGPGEVEIALLSLDQAGGSVGLAVGLDVSGHCQELTSLPEARVGDAVAGWVVQSSYCAEVFDTGTLMGRTAYRLTVKTPEAGSLP
jgi:hypothetical protein